MPHTIEDGQEHEQVGLERRNVVASGRARHVEADVVGEEPAAGHEEQVARQHHLLEEPGARLQHARAPASRVATYRSMRSLKSRPVEGSRRGGGAPWARSGPFQTRSAGWPPRGPPRSGARRRARWRARSRREAPPSPGRPLPEGDHGPPGRHGLERRDAEVLEGGEDQGAAARVELRRLGVVAPPVELDGRAGHGAKPRLFRPASPPRRGGGRDGWPPPPPGPRACTG